MMKFVFPNPDYEEQAKAFIREFQEYGSEICGSAGLARYLENASYGQ